MDNQEGQEPWERLQEYLLPLLIFGIFEFPWYALAIVVVAFFPYFSPQNLLMMLMRVIEWFLLLFIGHIISEIWFPDFD